MMDSVESVSRRHDDCLHLGVSWYPECWPREEWRADVARMRELGITLVRLFEFAWHEFEPREGEYHFEWAREVLDLLHAAGIRVMLGTPTAAPPIWLTSKYPEVLRTGPDGRQHQHGQRKHYNPHSRQYRKMAAQIAEKMAQELGRHPAVHSWQIDNEMSGYDYGPETREAFHQWLIQRYGTVDELNRRWGLQFWSQAYDDFRQVPLCVAEVGSREVPERHHPSLLMAIARFQNDGWTDFMRVQIEAIRRHASQPITTNMTGTIGPMDWFQHFRLMDRSGVSMYADLSHYHHNYFRFDRLRAEKPAPFWLLETAPNWSGGGPIWNIHHDERGIRAFSWMTILFGGSMVLYWQWRGHWAGQEMQHGTCVSQTGKWMPGKNVWRQLAREFRELGPFLIQHPAARARVALVVASESAWAFSIDPIDPQKNHYVECLRDKLHVPLVRHHLHRDVIEMRADFSPYRVLVLPRLPILPHEVRVKLADWVRAGGTAILGPMTGTRSDEMTIWADRELGGLEDWVGAKVVLRFTPHWVEETIRVVFEDGSWCHPEVWCEAYEPFEGTRVRARYEGGYGDGWPAVVESRVGQGKVVMVGAPLSPEKMAHLILEEAGALGIEPLSFSGEESDGVLCLPRCDSTGAIVALGLVNSRKEPRRITLRGGGRDLLAHELRCEREVELAPLQVRLVLLDEPLARC